MAEAVWGNNTPQYSPLIGGNTRGFTLVNGKLVPNSQIQDVGANAQIVTGSTAEAVKAATPATNNGTGSLWGSLVNGINSPIGGAQFGDFAKLKGIEGFSNAEDWIKAGASPEDIAARRNSFNSWQNNQMTWGDLASGAFSLGTGIYGMIQANRNYKLQKENMREMQALNRANYQNQAKAYNNNLRNQQSGRSFEGMSGSATRALGREYNERKARENY